MPIEPATARCVPRRRGFPQGPWRKNLAGWFSKKKFPGGPLRWQNANLTEKMCKFLSSACCTRFFFKSWVQPVVDFFWKVKFSRLNSNVFRRHFFTPQSVWVVFWAFFWVQPAQLAFLTFGFSLCSVFGSIYSGVKGLLPWHRNSWL